MIQQQHHDKAEEHAEIAARLLQPDADGSESQDAGIPAMSGESVVGLAQGFAAVTQAHATLATVGDL